MAASHHGDTPYSGRPVTSGSVTPYTTSVDVNHAGGVDQTTAVTAAAGLAAVMVTLGAVWVARADEVRTNSGDGESRPAARSVATPAVAVTRRAVSQRDQAFPYSRAGVGSDAESDESDAASRSPRAGGRTSPIIAGDIPQQAAGFQPRMQLFGSLLNSPPGVPRTRLFVVIGPRGVGKSQLAAAYARKRLTENWQMVAWMSAEDQGQLLTAFEQLADALGLTRDGQDFQERAHLIRAGGII